MQDVDDLTLRRFLRARNLDVEKASAMFMKYFTWRRTFVPKGSISASEIPNQIAHNKVFMQGTDKRGCPVAVIFGARHFPCKGNRDEFKRKYTMYKTSLLKFMIILFSDILLKFSGFVVFALDKLCSRYPVSIVLHLSNI